MKEKTRVKGEKSPFFSLPDKPLFHREDFSCICVELNFLNC
ncbi:hypothetical protein SAMN04488121_106264 [Chitinophaga filiformis]|uniref:Uncharacterized protein n=1 Tax=Chitinophaga filiformis TaxID=104663 RepID=A0A1G7X3I8_CHIFI|nr:hypothetical protein SAMN04488121_106264 [Chitinophaga filiformis]